MASTEKQLQMLLRKPFGPYDETFLLDAHSAPTALELRKVYITRDSVATGLDIISDRLVTNYQTDKDVHFYGILRIENISWLLPAGLGLLEKHLQERDQAMSADSTRPSKLRLAGIYQNDVDYPKVYICCKKALQAHFLTGKSYSNDLILYTMNGRGLNSVRPYIVKSLHVRTYKLSQKYLEHWRFHMFLENLDKTKYPPECRSYKIIIQCRREAAKVVNKYVFSDDSDIDDDNCPMQPRHISTAEATHDVASHCIFILAQILATDSPAHWLVHRKSFFYFCKLAKLRLEVGNPAQDLVEDLADFGLDKARIRKVIKGISKDPDPAPLPTKHILLKTRQLPRLPTPAVPVQSQHYDSDFSEDSSSEAMDSDDAVPDTDEEYILKNIIPASMRKSAQFCGGYWSCPVSDCVVEYFAHDLSCEDKDVWLINEVDRHYYQHLENWDIYIEEAPTQKKRSIEFGFVKEEEKDPSIRSTAKIPRGRLRRIKHPLL